MKNKILIIEDETKYSFILEKYFLNEDFEVALAFDGMEGLFKFQSFNPDIICLDIMLPKMNGYEVAQRIREQSDVPIIMMSALSDETDILKGYELKIDDYITKPFRNSILVAKVKTILSRRQETIEKIKNESINDVLLVCGKIKLVLNTMECFINGDLVKLTKTEFMLLAHLMKNVGKTCTRESLMSSFWEEKDTDERIIDTYIKKLRKITLNTDTTITTVFGIGYKLEENK